MNNKILLTLQEDMCVPIYDDDMLGYVFGVVNLSDSARAMESSKRQRREEASPASRVQGSDLPC